VYELCKYMTLPWALTTSAAAPRTLGKEGNPH
jgi:hypothetical protein